MIEIIGPALNQWDTGRSVKVTDIEASHVHFANKGDTKAVIMEIVDSHARIPDYLFHTGKQLCVYAVKDGITVESKIFYVKTRERPENYVYEDDQRNYIYELIQNAQTAADNATAVAQELREAKDSGELKGDPGEPATDDQVAAAVEAYMEEHPVEVPDVDMTGVVKSVNGTTPDENGNVVVAGAPGSPGKDGTSVTVKSVSESTEDGGSNVVTFSDGKTVTIKNGSKGSSGANGRDGYTPQKNVDYFDGKDGKDGAPGSPGKDGTSVTVKSVSESAADGGSNVVTFSDGKTVTIKNGGKGSTGAKGADGYTPQKNVDYFDGKDGKDGKDGLDATPITPLFVNTIEECTDTTKPYVLPDGFIYAYILTDTDPEPLFTNMIDGATIKTGYRYSLSSAAFKAQTGCDAVVFKIPTSGSITIRLRGCTRNDNYPQVYGGTSSTAFSNSHVTDLSAWKTDSNGDQYCTFTNSAGSTYVCAMMNTVDTSKAIVTVNEEIAYTTGGMQYAWANTGHAFVPADYEDRIIAIEKDNSEQAEQISNIEKRIENLNADDSLEAAYTRIKNWNYPIFEDAPVFLLETNKPAMGATEPMTTDGIYAKYDALMAANSHFITRENCGMASDGTTPIYAYHFKEPDPRSPYQGMWREKKPVILACSGVHQEWAGVYALYYAMEEITTNTKLLDLRRNVHFVIFPMLNPTAAMDAEYKMRNPDGIQVHHNFEVGHGENGAVQGDRYYGGETPLSIPETQYFDALMNRYKDDLSCVLSCHNNVVDEKYGTSFIWCSCATYFMTNLGNRLAEKMSSAWLEKHGDALVEGIRWANNYALEQAATGTHPFFKDGFTTAQPEWDLRIGWAGISGSGGTEYRHGMKYGVHGINVEVCPRCVLDKNYNAEYTSNVMTMGAETYVNFFRTYMAVYDPKDKKDYAPNLPWCE